MKKLIKFSIVFLVMGLAMTGCKKDKPQPEIPEIPDLTEITGKINLPPSVETTGVTVSDFSSNSKINEKGEYSLENKGLAFAYDKNKNPIYTGIAGNESKEYTLNAKETAIYYSLLAFGGMLSNLGEKNNIQAYKDMVYSFDEVKRLENKIETIVRNKGYFDVDEAQNELMAVYNRITTDFFSTTSSSPRSAMSSSAPITWNTKFYKDICLDATAIEGKEDTYSSENQTWKLVRNLYSARASVVGVKQAKFNPQDNLYYPVGSWVYFTSPYFPKTAGLGIVDNYEMIREWVSATQELLESDLPFWETFAEMKTYSKKSELEFIYRDGQTDGLLFMTGKDDATIFVINWIYVYFDIVSQAIKGSMDYNYLEENGLAAGMEDHFFKYVLAKFPAKFPNLKRMIDNNQWEDFGYEMIDIINDYLLEWIGDTAEDAILTSIVSNMAPKFAKEAEIIFGPWSKILKIVKAGSKFACTMLSDEMPSIAIPLYPNPNFIDELSPVQTGDYRDVTDTSAVITGEVVDTSPVELQDKGFYYSTDSNPAGENRIKISLGNSRTNFFHTLSDLIPSTTYYYVAYASYRSGTRYGEVKSFTTAATKPAVDPSLSVAPTDISTGYTGGSYAVAVTGNSTWTVASNTAWCTVLPTTGSGNGTITVSVTENASEAQRSAAVTIAAGTLTQTVTVTQAPSPVQTGNYRDVTSASAVITGEMDDNYPGELHDRGFYYSTDGNPTGKNGIKISLGNSPTSFFYTLSGLIPSTTYYYVAYASYGSGICYGKVKSFVTAAAGPAIEPSLSVTPATISADSTGGSYEVTVVSNSAWRGSSNAAWCTVSPATGVGNGKITITVTKNASTAERSATVTIAAGTLTQTVTVTQEPPPSTPSYVAGGQTGDCTWTLTGEADNYTLTISGHGAMANDPVYFHPVTPWEQYGSGIKTLVIQDGVTAIGMYAFYGCRGLTSVNIPNSVTTIGERAFYGCRGLTSVNIPNSVTTIGDVAFYGCSGLTSVTIPNSVITIGGSAFSGCGGLTSVTIPNSVTTIGGSAFSGCGGLTSVTIPNSVTTIGGGAFEGCTGLTSVTIPNSVIAIGDGAFMSCHGLISVTIPNSVTIIGARAFDSCVRLTSVTIPNSVTTIGEGTFFNCDGLTSVTIPNSVTIIGEQAFSYCDGLISMTIPNSVTIIGAWAFNYSRGLTSVTNYSTTPQSIDSSTFASVNVSAATLRVPASAVDAYKNAEGWKDFGTIVGI